MKKFLVIQTAFIGDAILATALLEKLRKSFPKAQLDILVRQGNETLFDHHPYVGQCLVWEKKQAKWCSLWKLLKAIRRERYDVVVNCQRFFASGLLAAFSGAKWISGFRQNPLSFLFHHKVQHDMHGGIHETERNQLLIAPLSDFQAAKPKLFPKKFIIYPWPYVCLAPASVWATKQWPVEKWVELLALLPQDVHIHFLGGPDDHALIEQIMASANSNHQMHNFAGKLSLLQSAAMLKLAQMNYVNDSAPMHLCSAMNAPVTAIYCSTIPSFGFGPLSDQAFIWETASSLPCRPCGVHGHKSCPQKHFRCALEIVPKPMPTA